VGFAEEGESTWDVVTLTRRCHRQSSMDLKSRGRKLVLQYAGGSPCGQKKSSSKRSSLPIAVRSGAESRSKALPGGREDERFHAHGDQKPPPPGNTGGSSSNVSSRKSATISFLCNQDPSNPQTAVSFVGADPDECAYFFEVRSRHACLSAEPRQPGGVGPGGVFALILGIFLVVYFAGGVFYQRTVSHARGWRQLPNYNLWRGIFSFVTVQFPRSFRFEGSPTSSDS
jgi:cation-dependent mannose-6-phosphate receptor